MKKRILFISEATEHMAGAEKSMLEIISMFDERFECFVGKVKSNEFKDEVNKIGVKQIDICLHENKGLINYVKNIIKTVKLLKKNKIGLVYITSSGTYWKPAEILAAKIAGVPVITHLRWWKYNLKGFLKYSDKIICNSKFTAQKLLRSKLRRKIEVVMNFVKFDKLKVKKIRHKGVNVAYIGQMNPIKGIKYLIDAARELKNINFLLVGRDGGAYPDYKNEMKEYAKGLKNVKFLDYTKDVSSVYNKTDIFVLPSLEEPFGRVLVEAGYFRIPCVASNVGGIPEVIDEILVEPKDPESIKESIVKLKDSKLRKRIGENGRKKVLENFDPSVQIKKIEKICLRLAR